MMGTPGRAREEDNQSDHGGIRNEPVPARPLLVDLVRGWLRCLGHLAIDVRLSKLGTWATMIGAIELARDVARLPQERGR